MRDHTYIPFFIISAERTESDILAHSIATYNLQVWLERSGHKFSKIEGSYKGEKEAAFIVYTSDTKLPIKLAKWFKQDCVLLRNGLNDCTLWYSEQKQEFIGHFKQATKEEALKLDAYSLIDGEYWIVTRDRNNARTS